MELTEFIERCCDITASGADDWQSPPRFLRHMQVRQSEPRHSSFLIG
jgi:hypothetical protein